MFRSTLRVIEDEILQILTSYVLRRLQSVWYISIITQYITLNLMNHCIQECVVVLLYRPPMEIK